MGRMGRRRGVCAMPMKGSVVIYVSTLLAPLSGFALILIVRAKAAAAAVASIYKVPAPLNRLVIILRARYKFMTLIAAVRAIKV